ncbi:MAG: VWA domain-containing protein, partial [Deltaproteobacteria bacterium]|nr:VWA domain-containing protein [Deltaproteobacteria bacterium]
MTKSTPLHFYYWYRWLSLLIFLTGSGLFTLTIYAALPIPLTVEITQVDIQNFPSVLFYATITGDQDTHVTDVTADHITVYEKYDASDDSAYAAQTGVSILESIGANNGINIALIFDASGSMQGSEAEVKSAANSLLGEFGINDRAGIIFFANTIDVEQLFIGSTIDSDTSDDTSTDLYKAVDNYQYVPSGRTRLYRGIEEGIIQLNQESGIKAVVVIADGADDGADIPDISKTELITFAQNSNIPVYSIGVGDTLDPEDLQDIATQTGGQYYAGSQAGGIEQIYDDIYSRLGSQYEIVYTTSNSAADGSTRSIKMEVDNSDGVLPFGERTYIVGIPPTIVRNQDTIAFSTGTHSTSEIIIKAQIEDPDDTTTDANIAAALFFRGVDSNSSYAQRAMTYNIAGSDFNFEATLTAIEVQQFGTENGGVEYYLRASDG